MQTEPHKNIYSFCKLCKIRDCKKAVAGKLDGTFDDSTAGFFK